MLKNKYEHLSEHLSMAINELEGILIKDEFPDHRKRYENLLMNLKQCKEEADNKGPFEFERANFGLGLLNYLVEWIDSYNFYVIICDIEGYFFNEFLLK